MKRTLYLAVLLLAALSAEPAGARLRTLGTIGNFGLSDQNVLHIAIVLENCEWEAVVSQDGGQTWRVGQRAQLPAVLGGLPLNGQIRYIVADKGNCLIRSDDGGRSWHDISPWRFLERTIYEDVQSERQSFLARYAHRLPDDTAWPLVFGATALVLCGLGGWGCWRQQRQWLEPALLSLMTYLFVGLGLFAVHCFWSYQLCGEQWSYLRGHWDGGVEVPLWPLGVVMNLTGNAWLAFVPAIACFPMTPLFGSLIRRPSNSARSVFWAFAAAGPAVALAVLIIVSDLPGIGRGRGYSAKPSADQRDGAAVGSQVVHSRTNQPSAEAGPRR